MCDGNNKNKTWIILLIACNVAMVHSFGENWNFNEFLETIQKNIMDSLAYVLPKDNAELMHTNSDVVEDFGTFDFIVVGSGAGGAVVANRLSEIRDWKVLLLEAGGEASDFQRIVGLVGFFLLSDKSWGYNSTPQAHACYGLLDHQCNMVSGKVIGGSTGINGVIYNRGHREDYDRWAYVHHNLGWSYDEVLPYFKKSENAVFLPRDEAYHGVGGPFTVNVTGGIPGMTEFLSSVYKELGLDYLDYNGQYENGAFRIQMGLKGNERGGTAATFLNPYIHRDNLKISLNSFVTKVIISDETKTAEGVEFVKNGIKYIAKARKEVILSAGSYNSPQILMLSGIGPKEHLEELDIPVIADLPVGKELREQVMYFGLVVRTNLDIIKTDSLKGLLEKYVNHQEPLISSSQVVAFSNLNNDQSIRPDLEFLNPAVIADPILAKRIYGLGKEFEVQRRDFWFLIILLQPKSIGTVTLKSKDPKDWPIINPNFLSDERDADRMFEAVQFLARLNGTKTMEDSGSHVVVFNNPECVHLEKMTKKWWRCVMKYYTAPVYHPMSTNKMGPLPTNSVVNPKLQVHGIRKLRVIDASVFPESVSAHTMAPTMMVAEMGSDFIKQFHGRGIQEHCGHKIYSYHKDEF